MAYRSGNYKIHFLTRERTRDPETGKREPSVRQMPELLFDVRNDPTESKNIASTYPDIVNRLKKEAEEVESAIKNWQPISN